MRTFDTLWLGYQDYSPSLSISLSAIDLSLYARNEVEVAVDATRRSQLVAFDVCCGISNAVALSPQFVPFDTGERTCSRGTARTEVFGRIDMTKQGLASGEVREGWKLYQILHRSLSKVSSILTRKWYGPSSRNICIDQIHRV